MWALFGLILLKNIVWFLLFMFFYFTTLHFIKNKDEMIVIRDPIWLIPLGMIMLISFLSVVNV